MNLRWPERSKGARVVLLSPLQDIDVYVEDVESREFYLEILRRVLPRRIRVKEVFEMGGRGRVLELCTKHEFARRAALFIIDGDFPWVRGDPPPHPDVFQLDAYCIENLLFDPKAIVEHVFLSDGGSRSRDELSVALDLQSWLAHVLQLLEELFLLFAVANKLAPQVTTVGRGPGSVLDQKGKHPKICAIKVAALKETIKDEIIRASSQAEFDLAWKEVYSAHRKRSRRHDVISGKDFLLPLLRIVLIRTFVKDSSDNRSFNLRLANMCSRRRFTRLKKAVEAAISMQRKAASLADTDG